MIDVALEYVTVLAVNVVVYDDDPAGYFNVTSPIAHCDEALPLVTGKLVPVMVTLVLPPSGPAAVLIDEIVGSAEHAADAISASMARVTGATTRSVATRDATRRRATAKLPFGPTRSPSVFVVAYPTQAVRVRMACERMSYRHPQVKTVGRRSCSKH